jgi:hypothetical protein
MFTIFYKNVPFGKLGCILGVYSYILGRKSTSFAIPPYIDPGARGTQYIIPYAYHIYTAVRPQDYQGLRVLGLRSHVSTILGLHGLMSTRIPHLGLRRWPVYAPQSQIGYHIDLRSHTPSPT